MKVLVIAYGFPPVAGMSPMRCTHVVRALDERGHEVTVLTAGMPVEYPRDDAMLDLVPARTRIIRVSAGRFSGFVRGSRHRNAGETRGNGADNAIAARCTSLARRAMGFTYHRFLKQLIIPDATIEWYALARKHLADLLAVTEFDVIYSFAYPFSGHYLGAFAARTRRLPWVMDYGDPWSINPHLNLPRWRLALDLRRERAFLKLAGYRVVTTAATKAAYVRAFPDLLPQSWVVATCGYSPEAYAGASAAQRDSTRFRLVYTGIYGLANRCELDLIRALQQLPDDRWELLLAGVNVTGNDEYLRDFCRDAGLSDRVMICGQRPHAEAVSLQLSADLLVAWGWSGGMQIPAKIFEYIGAGQPILLISGDRNDPAAGLIRELDRGLVVDSEVSDLVRVLADAQSGYLNGYWKERFDLTPREEFSWHNQADIIAGLCEELAAR